MLTHEDFEGLIGPILLKNYPDRTLMGAEDLKTALSGIPGIDGLTISYKGGNQILHIADKQVEIGPMASNEEIRAALQNPFVPTRNTKLTMAKSPLQGLGQKLGLAMHNAELDAAKIAAKVDELEARRQAAVPKVMAGLESHGQNVAELETFVTDLEKATNE